MATTKTTTKKTANKTAPAKKTVQKYDFGGYAGLANSTVNRGSGAQINIWFNAQTTAVKTNAALPWTVECETHGKTKEVALRGEARELRLHPEDFCPQCKAIIAKGGPVKEAPAKKAAAKKAPAKKAGKARKAA